MMQEVGPADPAHDMNGGGPMGDATPSRAAFLSTGTAEFHPPDW
jgi:hypothetical protein